MNSGYGYGASAMPSRTPGGYMTVETLLEDVARQMASSNLSRYSRGSNGQISGGSMRVIKPNSTSNSPRGSTGLSRRRTVMTDGPYRRRPTILDQKRTAQGGSNDSLHVPTRHHRPMSYPGVPRREFNDEYQIFELPQTPAVYSGFASPSTGVPPEAMAYVGNQQQCFYTHPEAYSLHQPYNPYQPSTLGPQMPNYLASSAYTSSSSMYSHFDWENRATNGFEHATAPPTPENFLPIQHPEPSISAEEMIPYHSLSDSEEAGEELVGMGLYDTPEVAKSPSADPQLDNYRALMSHLIGSGHRKTESTGKGLKLEETWNPPASDEEGDDNEDGEGEEEEEEEEEEMVHEHAVEASGSVADTPNPHTDVSFLPMAAGIPTQNGYHDGWL